MPKRIKSLTVDKISLLTSEHQPAVPKAGLGFSILKFWKKNKVEKKDKSKLDAIIEKLGAPKQPSQLDNVLETIEKAAGWDETTDMYRYRIKEPSLFESDSFRTVQLNKTGKTIKSVMGRLKGEKTMTMQNIMFPKDEWTKAEAKKWLKDHKDTIKKMGDEVESE